MSLPSLLARKARILGARLELGLAELEEIENWAEAALMSGADMPYEIVELTMARSAGIEEVIRLLGAVGGEIANAAEVLIAVGQANFDDLGPSPARDFLNHVANWGLSLQESSPAGRLLIDAYRSADELDYALRGEVYSMEHATSSARAYFSRVIEMAASLRAALEASP